MGGRMGAKVTKRGAIGQQIFQRATARDSGGELLSDRTPKGCATTQTAPWSATRKRKEYECIARHRGVAGLRLRVPCPGRRARAIAE